MFGPIRENSTPCEYLSLWPQPVSVLDGYEWPASRPSPFTPGQRAPQYLRKGRLGESDGQSERSSEEKNLLLLPAVQPAPWSSATAASALQNSQTATTRAVHFNICYNNPASYAHYEITQLADSHDCETAMAYCYGPWCHLWNGASNVSWPLTFWRRNYFFKF